MINQVSFLGFGEAAQRIGAAHQWQASIRAYDAKTRDPNERAHKLVDYEKAGVQWHETAGEAVDGAEIVISLVSPDEAIICASSVVRHVLPESWYFDMNSASPKSKKSAARELEMAGVKYVDVAIASPVEIDALSVPLLISGPHAKNAASALSSIGFENVRVVGNQVGDAAAIQMIRQVAILGFESITAECLLAAKASGLLTEVVASFGPNWLSDAEQRIDQMLTRGTRNAEVLTEVCATLYDLGVNPYGSLSTTMRQRELGQAKVASNSTTLDQKLESLTRKNGTWPISRHRV